MAKVVVKLSAAALTNMFSDQIDTRIMKLLQDIQGDMKLKVSLVKKQQLF